MLHGGPTKVGCALSPSTVPRPDTLTSFMNQICVSLVALLCHRMSAPLSGLKSPAPTTLHGSPTKAGWPFSPTTVPRPDTLAPFMNQIWVSFVALLCQRTSTPPSRLKSPTPTMPQGGPTKGGWPFSPRTVLRPDTFAPSMSQIWDSLEALLCQ